jgi:RimJ/RimL family protein N-acetyltransferase
MTPCVEVEFMSSEPQRKTVSTPTALPASDNDASTFDKSKLFLRRFQNTDAPAVASWIASPEELTYLAPGTVGPLTSEKIIAWGIDRENRFVLCHPASDHAIGYAELNRMPNRNDQMWIGHFIVDPACRHQSLGVRFVTALLERAFSHHAATEVLLVVFPDNQSAVRCYERAGMSAQGQERKSFPQTGREHLFLRMGIHVSRYQNLGLSVAASAMLRDLR